MDHHQYETGQGPCLAAATEGTEFHINSLASEDRWPDFVPLALDDGIRAILSTPVTSGGRAVGALNIYSNTDDAFGTSEHHVAELLATQASGIVTDVDAGSDHRRRTSDALAAREIIAQAQGVLMGRHHISAHQADGALHRGARNKERTVEAEAKWVVSTFASPQDVGRTSGP
ncbi:MAG: GAF domain-containing protein [Acidimicrobiales bacterium]